MLILKNLVNPVQLAFLKESLLVCGFAQGGVAVEVRR